MTYAVLGAGAWGTALALLLRARGHTVRLWARRAEQAADIDRTRRNREHLPESEIPADLQVTAGLGEALRGAERAVVAVPVQHIRETLGPARGLLAATTVRINASKGIERFTLKRVSELLSDIWGPGPYAVLSGPSFAVEVARGEPTAITVASDGETARILQREISTEAFRLYTSEDVVGVELAGALKNVVAIASGIVVGLGFGWNARAALLTRGLAEVRRLGVALGGRAETFLGLAGVGDLVLTGTGTLSRNLRVGQAIGAGRGLDEVSSSMGGVAEGIETARSAAALAARHDVELPITRAVVAVLFERRDPRSAMQSLMARDLKAE